MITDEQDNEIYFVSEDEVEEWLSHSPEYVIALIGTALWRDLAFVLSVLKVVKTGENLEDTRFALFGEDRDSSGQTAIQHLINKLEHSLQLISTSKALIDKASQAKPEDYPAWFRQSRDNASTD